MSRNLRLILELDGREPKVLASRPLGDDEPFEVYDLVIWVLGVMYRVITWKAFRDETRADFDSIIEQLGETA